MGARIDDTGRVNTEMQRCAGDTPFALLARDVLNVHPVTSKRQLCEDKDNDQYRAKITRGSRGRCHARIYTMLTSARHAMGYAGLRRSPSRQLIAYCTKTARTSFNSF